MDLRKRGFQLPDRVNVETDTLTDTYGKFYAEAFERGYGTTIGNSLRRILLSSIEGAAVTSVKIPGVFHEFSNISGVREDVIDILLNVKQLRFRMYTDTPKVATIKVKGPGEVKGKDIQTGAQVEVLSPDMHIATLEKNVEFKMELTVQRGRGYVSAEKNKSEDQPVDMISVDSIFTPVKKVAFRIESARVGQATDYDRLIMEVWTDGSVKPKQAITQAANILNNHISLFSLDEEEEAAETEEVHVEMNENEDPVVFNDNLFKNVDELELSVRAANCLKNANIKKIADLVEKTEQEMLRGKNFGRKSLNEIKEILTSMGLHFNMKIDPSLVKEELLKRKAESAS
jgi:DNA-directed RNA polymerase subunit alpha